MSYLVREVYHETVNRTTGNTERLALIIADDVSSLPVNTSAMTYILGSEARIVADGSKYIMNSSGTWVLQPSDNQFENVYTKAETDALISPLSNQLDTNTDALEELIDSGGKNRLKLSGTNVTGYGIQCTFDYANGTIHLNGINQDKKCTGSFNIQIADSRVLGLESGEVYDFSCDGYATSDDTIGVYVYTSGATPSTQFDTYNNTEAAWNSAWEQSNGFRLFIRQGTVVDNVTLKPMICRKELWDISHKFEPYCPTLAELYQMVLSI